VNKAKAEKLEQEKANRDTHTQEGEGSLNRKREREGQETDHAPWMETHSGRQKDCQHVACCMRPVP
jgi:hypothetical protein